MEIELKSVKLTKSKILQMDYVGVVSLPVGSLMVILGWVNIDSKRYVIIKKEYNNYYRADFIKNISTEIKGTQFPLSSGGWEFPHLTHVKVETFNRGWNGSFLPRRDEEENIKLYEDLNHFRIKQNSAGQIYY
jgi:hypothetical protein